MKEGTNKKKNTQFKEAPAATAELSNADAATLHHALHMEKNPSTPDLMSVITALKTLVESKFSTISDIMSAMQNTLSAVKERYVI